MKKNSYSIIIIFVFAFIAIEFSILCFCIKSTRVFPEMSIELEIAPPAEEENEIAISKASLEKLKNLLDDSLLINNQNFIIERFEKEHTFYINLITVLSILLAIFGIVPVIYGYFEKSENQKIYSELEDLKKVYTEQLKNINLQYIIEELQNLDKNMRLNANFLLDNSNVAKTENEFCSYLRNYFKNLFYGTDLNNLNDPFFGNLCIYLCNVMQTSLTYCNLKFGTNYNCNIKNEVVKNPVLYTMSIVFQASMSNENFLKLKNIIHNLPNSVIDFSDF